MYLLIWLYFNLFAACAEPVSATPLITSTSPTAAISPIQIIDATTDMPDFTRLPASSCIIRICNGPVDPAEVIIRAVTRAQAVFRGSNGEDAPLVGMIDCHDVLMKAVLFCRRLRDRYRKSYETAVSVLTPRERKCFNVLRSHHHSLKFSRVISQMDQVLALTCFQFLFVVSSMDPAYLGLNDCYNPRNILFDMLRYRDDSFRLPPVESLIGPRVGLDRNSIDYSIGVFLSQMGKGSFVKKILESLQNGLGTNSGKIVVGVFVDDEFKNVQDVVSHSTAPVLAFHLAQPKEPPEGISESQFLEIVGYLIKLAQGQKTPRYLGPLGGCRAHNSFPCAASAATASYPDVVGSPSSFSGDTRFSLPCCGSFAIRDHALTTRCRCSFTFSSPLLPEAPSQIPSARDAIPGSSTESSECSVSGGCSGLVRGGRGRGPLPPLHESTTTVTTSPDNTGGSPSKDSPPDYFQCSSLLWTTSFSALDAGDRGDRTDDTVTPSRLPHADSSSPSSSHPVLTTDAPYRSNGNAVSSSGRNFSLTLSVETTSPPLGSYCSGGSGMLVHSSRSAALTRPNPLSPPLPSSTSSGEIPSIIQTPSTSTTTPSTSHSRPYHLPPILSPVGSVVSPLTEASAAASTDFNSAIPGGAVLTSSSSSKPIQGEGREISSLTLVDFNSALKPPAHPISIAKPFPEIPSRPNSACLSPQTTPHLPSTPEVSFPLLDPGDAGRGSVTSSEPRVCIEGWDSVVASRSPSDPSPTTRTFQDHSTSNSGADESGSQTGNVIVARRTRMTALMHHLLEAQKIAETIGSDE